MPFSRWKTEGTLALLEGKLTREKLLFMSVKINHVNAPPLTLKKHETVKISLYQMTFGIFEVK
jgi:hypothetical protein